MTAPARPPLGEVALVGALSPPWASRSSPPTPACRSRSSTTSARPALAAGLGRALVYLNFPVSLAALAVLPVAVDRLGVSSPQRRSCRSWPPLLCAVTVLPGVVEQGDLDAKPVNLVPAAGVALVVALVVASARGTGPRRARPARAARTPSGSRLRRSSSPCRSRGSSRKRASTRRTCRCVGRVFMGDELRPEPGAADAAGSAPRPAPRPRRRAARSDRAGAVARRARSCTVVSCGRLLALAASALLVLRAAERGAGRLVRAGREARLDGRAPAQLPAPVARVGLGRRSCSESLPSMPRRGGGWPTRLPEEGRGDPEVGDERVVLALAIGGGRLPRRGCRVPPGASSRLDAGTRRRQGYDETLRRRGRVVRQRPAKPFTPVRVRSAPWPSEGELGAVDAALRSPQLFLAAPAPWALVRSHALLPGAGHPETRS